VLDIGAHRGYLAAYAFMKGAAAVVSFEPQSENYGLIRESRDLSPAVRDRWKVFRLGVGVAHGEMDLLVSERSRSHTFHAGAKSDIVAREKVIIVPLTHAVDIAHVTVQAAATAA